MTIYRKVRTFIDNFDRDITFVAGTPNGFWTIKDTSAAGTPTYTTATADGGGLTLTIANTNEAEIVTLYQSDKLFYDLRYLQHLWWIVKVASVDALTVLTAGFGNAQADDEDTMTVSAWFKMEGATSVTALVVEADDATTDYPDVATGTTLAAVYKKLHLDLTNGLSDVRFLVDGARVAGSAKFDMSAAAAGQNVQPFLQISKPSGVGVPAVSIAEFGIQYEYAY